MNENYEEELNKKSQDEFVLLPVYEGKRKEETLLFRLKIEGSRKISLSLKLNCDQLRKSGRRS